MLVQSHKNGKKLIHAHVVIPITRLYHLNITVCRKVMNII